MASTSLLTGDLAFVLIVSLVMTALVSAFLLWLYRRSVLRAMKSLSGIELAPQKSVASGNSRRSIKSSSISIIDYASWTIDKFAGHTKYPLAKKSLNHATIVYSIGGLIYALIMTAAWMIESKSKFGLTKMLWIFTCFIWPVIVTISLINPINRKRAALFYTVITFIIVIVAWIRNGVEILLQFALYWLIVNGIGTILLSAFLNRKVRAVGPLVLAFMITAVTGTVVIINIAGSGEGILRNIVNIGHAMGLGAKQIFLSLIIIGFGMFGLVGWKLLQWLGRQYQKKQMSDQSITLDSLWILFSFVNSVILVNDNILLIFTGLLAFVAYKASVLLGFLIFVQREKTIVKMPELLLLRVFSLGKRSERLYEVINKVWLRTGSINLIAGPDLLTATVEPHEFLSFISGHLSRQFVSDKQDLLNRMLKIDTCPDPDGRYRVNEFFCRDDTWQITIRHLALRSNVILMDLRSFSRANQGCTYELGELLNFIPLDQIILVEDDSTDHIFLEETIKAIMQHLDTASPNQEKINKTIQLFTLKRKRYDEIEKLLMLLLMNRNASLTQW